MIQLPDIESMTGRNKAFVVAELISEIFGISSPIFVPYGDAPEYKARPFQNIQIIEPDEPEAYTAFGIPVYGVFSFNGSAYNTYDKTTGQVKTVKMPDMQLPLSCVAEFNRPMIITETPTLGATGTVKEIYGLSDWKIRIRGLALNERLMGGTLTAQQQIDELVKWRDVCDAIQITGKLFNDKEIYRIAMKDFAIRPVEGRYGVIPFEIEALSDEPIELLL